MLETTLWILAISSSAIFVIRMIMMMVGADSMDAGAEVGAPTGGDGFHNVAHGTAGDIQIISTFTIIAFLMTGSWAALVFVSAFPEYSPAWSLLVGGVVGFVFMYLSALLISRLRRLEQDGTLRDFDPKGLRGEVYVTVPKAGDGEGQVKLEVKGRMKIFQAVNEDDKPIESFKPVIVTGMTQDHVLRVRHTG